MFLPVKGCTGRPSLRHRRKLRAEVGCFLSGCFRAACHALLLTTKRLILQSEPSAFTYVSCSGATWKGGGHLQEDVGGVEVAMKDFLPMHVRHASADMLEYRYNWVPSLWEMMRTEVAPLYCSAQAATIAELLNTLISECEPYNQGHSTLRYVATYSNNSHICPSATAAVIAHANMILPHRLFLLPVAVFVNTLHSKSWCYEKFDGQKLRWKVRTRKYGDEITRGERGECSTWTR